MTLCVRTGHFSNVNSKRETVALHKPHPDLFFSSFFFLKHSSTITQPYALSSSDHLDTFVRPLATVDDHRRPLFLSSSPRSSIFPFLSSLYRAAPCVCDGNPRPRLPIPTNRTRSGELLCYCNHPCFYIFRERELIYDLFEAATGMRMMHNFFRIGGVAADLPHGWIDKCLDFCDYFLTGVVEYQKLITRNPIFLEQVEGIGIVSGKEVINWGLSGPMLRASEIQWDLRKVENYECYGEFDWDVQWQKEGDSLARYLVRIGEMVESIKIIQQALEGIPGGPYENLEIRYFDREREPEWNDFEYRFISKKPSPTFELPKQELYVRVEAPKGELEIFLIGDQNGFPWRWKIRPATTLASPFFLLFPVNAGSMSFLIISDLSGLNAAVYEL
ncbi:NAD(P)H-quinone oxidoreductase subunit H, chloroplastic-like [Arachis duranensis]|uniref:NAD(P)H-quinone oxidoreductase subunit H, chloroplastic-like n=1 Tax=Arachis duranensis TaxID=130453 RepID=A0A6P4D4E4_ARADU|nr:NAD(P)H-quinone oxidoreductase subunit H, chloroplastic-like [Arachis duranensis]